MAKEKKKAASTTPRSKVTTNDGVTTDDVVTTNDRVITDESVSTDGGVVVDSQDEHQDVSDDRGSAIARRAYELYAARGFEDGHDLEDWLTAESQV